MTARFVLASVVLSLVLAAAPSPAKAPDYAEMIRQWHQAAPLSTRPFAPAGWPALVLQMVNTGERVELMPEHSTGGFSAEDLARAAKGLRDPKSGESMPVNTRVLDLAYQLETHFDVAMIRVVSGYRGPRGTNGNHGRGRAIDLIVPGVSDEDVATFARRIGFVGVGIYPESGFIHLDVRSSSFFWSDSSRPGKKSQVVQILPELSAQADADALGRGEPPGEGGESPPDDDASKPVFFDQSDCTNLPGPTLLRKCGKK
jgi:uncharacterized protein YcbK (DUF882 family)